MRLGQDHSNKLVAAHPHALRRKFLAMMLCATTATIFPAFGGADFGAAWAKNGSEQDDDDSGDGGSDNSGHGGSDSSGSGNSGSGSSGSGNGGSGNGGSGRGNAGNGGSASGNSGGATGKGSGDESRGAEEIFQVRFADGHLEQIYDDRFERTDRAGRFVERRPATGDDLSRLAALRQSARGDLQSLIQVSASQGAARLIDGSGWEEVITKGIYQLTDPNGNLVMRRAATGDDMARISAMAGFR